MVLSWKLRSQSQQMVGPLTLGQVPLPATLPSSQPGEGPPFQLQGQSFVEYPVSLASNIPFLLEEGEAAFQDTEGTGSAKTPHVLLQPRAHPAPPWDPGPPAADGRGDP